MLQHPGYRISLESYRRLEVGVCALMHTHEEKYMEKTSLAKGASSCLSSCLSYSFPVSVIPFQVTHQLLRPLKTSLLRAGNGCRCELQKSSKALPDPVLQTGVLGVILLRLALTFHRKCVCFCETLW